MLHSEKIERKNDLKKYNEEAEILANKIADLRREERMFGRTKYRDKKIRALQNKQDELIRIIRGRARAIGILSNTNSGDFLC